MQVMLSERVKTFLNTLSRDDREKVHTWFGYLRNWEDDPFVQAQSVALNVQGQSVYLFRTSTDLRIFYTVDLQSKTVYVIDIATKDTILSSGSMRSKGRLSPPLERIPTKGDAPGDERRGARDATPVGRPDRPP